MSFTCAPKEQVLVTMYLSDEMLCGQQQTAAENPILTRGSQPFLKAELSTKMVYKVTNFHVYTVSNTEFLMCSKQNLLTYVKYTCLYLHLNICLHISMYIYMTMQGHSNGLML